MADFSFILEVGSDIVGKYKCIFPILEESIGFFDNTPQLAAVDPIPMYDEPSRKAT